MCLLCRALLAALLLSWSIGAANAAEYRAFWVDAWGTGFLSQSQVDTLLGVPGTSNAGQIRDANCNAVIVQVRRNGDACYPSSLGEPYMSGLSPANFNALQAMINAAHDTTGGKKRIEVHCWIVTFRTSGGTVYARHSSTPTGSLTTLDNYWPSRDDSGAEVSDKAFDPGHPLALQYTVNVALDLVNHFDIDGIHYDYIRFTADDQGYNPTSIARYNARYGLTGQPAYTDEQFKQWRRDQVSAVVRQAYARIQKSKPWVKQSGSFVTWNPSPTSSTRAGFQATRPYYDVYSDWDSWLQEGIVDLAVPMTYYDWSGSYPADYTRWMNFEKDRHGNRLMVIGPGVYLNYLNDAITVLQKTREASPAGNHADGFSGYCYRNPYAITKGSTYGSWASFAAQLVPNVTPAWDDIPAMPWKTSPTTGHLMGVVTLAGTGAWADGARVSITGPASRSMYVDGTGFYAFIDLPPGSYIVTASKAGYPNASAPVTVAVGAVTGNMYQQDFALSLNSPPSITSEPESQSVIQGGNATLTVTASGSAPLAYQWRWYGTNLAWATGTSLSLTGLSTNQGGPYCVVVTNAYGAATSQVATLTVSLAFPAGGLSRLWSLAPGSRSYLTVAAPPNERGLAYNPVSRHLILVSRTSPMAYVLDADTGADLWTLDMTGVSGGYSASYYLLMVGVADDGAVYAGNMTLYGNTTAFKLYRWANDSPSTVPTVAYSGDPGAGNSQRWGDTLDVRGAGTNTRIIIGSRNANLVAVLTTANGTSFTSRLIIVADAPAGAFGLGIAFGSGDTFWGKATGQNLRQVAFDLAAGTGTTMRSHADPAFPGSIGPIGVSTELSLLGGIPVGATGNNFRLYNLTPTNGTPVFITSTNFATDNDNTYTGTGAVDFGGDRVYALGSDNGIIALQIIPQEDKTPPVISLQVGLVPERQVQVQVSGSPGHYAIAAATNPVNWADLTNFTITNRAFLCTDPETNMAQRFYRARRLP